MPATMASAIHGTRRDTADLYYFRAQYYSPNVDRFIGESDR